MLLLLVGSNINQSCFFFLFFFFVVKQCLLWSLLNKQVDKISTVDWIKVLLVKRIVIKVLKLPHSPGFSSALSARGRVGAQQEHYHKVLDERIAPLDVKTAVGRETVTGTLQAPWVAVLQSSSSCLVSFTSIPLYRGGTKGLPDSGNLQGASYSSSPRYSGRRKPL